MGGVDTRLLAWMLIARVGARSCAIPVEHVVETLRPLPIEALPGMPAFTLGVAIIRGEPVVVLDAARLLGDDEPGARERFVVLRVGARRVALRVDAVLGVRPLRRDELREVPALTGVASREVVEAIGRLDAELVAVLDAGHLVAQAGAG